MGQNETRFRLGQDSIWASRRLRPSTLATPPTDNAPRMTNCTRSDKSNSKSRYYRLSVAGFSSTAAHQQHATDSLAIRKEGLLYTRNDLPYNSHVSYVLPSESDGQQLSGETIRQRGSQYTEEDSKFQS